MAEVVLVYPSTAHESIRPSLGILYLGAILLEKGYDVALIDETVQKNARELLKEYITDKTICVGLSAMTGEQLFGALNVSKAVRDINPDLPIIWGGVHPTLAPEDTLKHEMVDVVCLGEGEITFPKMVKAFKDSTSLDNIDGIGFKQNGEMILTKEPTEFFDLNDLPSLPYHLLDMSLYTMPSFFNFFGFESKKVCSLETSRGCPFRCYYCVQAVKCESFRVMSKESILKHIQDIVDTGATGVLWVDDNFFTHHKKSVEIMEAIREKNWNLEIFVAVRSDYLKRLDDSDFELMKAIGIKLLGIGVESGSNRMLEIMKKKENIETTLEVNRKLAKHKIYAYFHFIVGFPEETLDDIIQTYIAMTKILKENPYSKVTNKKLIPNPNTPAFDACIENGMDRPTTIEEWANILDLAWEQKSPYLDKDAEKWFHNTQYYSDFMVFLSRMRAPYNTFPQKIARALSIPIFHIFSWMIMLRAKLKFSGVFIDSLLSPIALFCRKMVKKISKKT